MYSASKKLVTGPKGIMVAQTFCDIFFNEKKRWQGTVTDFVIPTTFTIVSINNQKVTVSNSTFSLFIQIIVNVVGRAKTITVTFGYLCI
jgi:hypothetical protein